MSVPEKVRRAVVGSLGFLAEAATLPRVEVVRGRALVRIAQATASCRVEVVASRAVSMHAVALTLLREPFVADGAVQRLADAGAGLLVPNVVLFFTSLNDAF